MILSFYSYKGGVGRTSLALDTAARIALGSEDRPPLRTLVWDLDLDAPGVRHFPALRELAARATHGTRDLLALLEPRSPVTGEMLEAGEAEVPEVGEAEVLEVLRHSIVWDRDLAGGRLALLLPTGTATAATGQAAADPAILFGPGAPGPSLLVLAADLARRELGFDVIVVDARTGINDMAATATTVLADCAVLVFRLDGQDLSHLEQIASAFDGTWYRAGATGADLPNRLYRVANLVPSGDPQVQEAVDERRRELADLRLEPHLELALRPLALVRESTPRLDDGPALDDDAELALEGLADWAVKRWADLQRRDGMTPATSAEPEPARPAPAGTRLEEEVATLLRLGGWRTSTSDGEILKPFDVWAEKTGEFGRREVLLVECKASRRGVSVMDVERLSRLAAEHLERPHHEVMLVAHSISPRAAEAARVRNILLTTPGDLLDEQAPGAALRRRAKELWEGTALERQYVPPTVVALGTEGAPTAERAPLDEYVLSWLDRGKPGLLCVLGDFGAGKTTFCQRLAATLAGSDDSDAPLPLYVDLRAAGSTALTLDGLLRHALDEAQVDQPRLEPWRHRLKQGSLILLVDGFDELLGYTDPARMEGLLEELQRAAGVGRVVLTSRSSYFRSDRDAVLALRGRRSPDKRAGTALWNQLQRGGDINALEVQPFDDEQVHRYLTQRFGASRVETILPRLRALHPVDDLLGRPYLLTLVATSIDQWEANGWPTRLTLTSVYESYVADWLTRDEPKHRGLPAAPRSLAQHLARVLWDRPSAQIGSRELRREASLWGSTASGRAISPDEEEMIEAKVRTALFLVRDERGDYRFAHRSFLEFFVAKGLAEVLREDPELERARAALDLARLTPEVATFLAGWPESWSAAPRACETVLDAPAVLPRASANALLLKVWHDRAAIEDDTSSERPAVSVAHAELEQVDLSRADLSAIVLRGANLSGADLSGANLAGADLRGANLAGIRAAQSDFSGADLRDAQLQGADLADVGMANARLERANLRAANLPRAVLRGAGLGKCQLVGARLNQADISGATASGADFSRARLVGATMNGVDLRNAAVQDVDLRFATLRGAKLPVDASANVYAARVTPPRSVIRGAGVDHVAPDSAAICPAQVGGRGHIAIGCLDGSVRLWDPERGELRIAHSAHHNSVAHLCPLSGEDGVTLASADLDGKIALWDARAEESPGMLAGPGSIQTMCQVTLPDGSPGLAAGGDLRIDIWDIGRRVVRMTLEGLEADAMTMCEAMLPDGTRRLVTAGENGAIRLWNINGDGLSTMLSEPATWVLSLCPLTLPDGTPVLASAGMDQVIRLWDLEEGAVLSTLSGHTDWIRALCSVAMPDGTTALASGGDDRVIRLWDVERGEQLASLPGHTGWVFALCPITLPDGTIALASGGDDEIVHLWDIEEGERLIFLRVSSSRSAQIHTLSPTTASNGRSSLVTVSRGSAVRVWNPDRGALTSVLVNVDTDITAACPFTVGQGSTGIATGDEQQIRVWDTERRESPVTVDHSSGRITALCQVHLDDWPSALVSASSDGALRVWDMSQGRQVQSMILRHEGTAFALCGLTLPSGAGAVASAGHGQTAFVHVLTGGEASTMPLGQHRATITALCPVRPHASAELALASADAEGTIHVWPLAGGAPLSLDHGHRVDALCALTLGDGSPGLASAGADGAVRLWRVGSGELYAVFERSGRATAICAVPLADGADALAIAHNDGTVLLCDLAGRTAVRLIAADISGDWMAYRENGAVGDPVPAAWGTEQALDSLLLAGGRWTAVDVRLTYPATLRALPPADWTFA